MYMFGSSIFQLFNKVSVKQAYSGTKVRFVFQDLLFILVSVSTSFKSSSSALFNTWAFGIESIPRGQTLEDFFAYAFN